MHILHDDDRVRPGFYAALRDGIERSPSVGAAFCRHAYIDPSGRERWVSWLERESPGIIENWLDRIAVFCRLQPPSIVVKRSVYEHLGGFTPAAGSAFDWEMWVRIAVHYPVWFEPRPLADFREHPAAATVRLLKSGRQIADSRRVIEIAESYLPKSVAAGLAAKAREQYARYALEVAKTHLEAGEWAAGLRNIREGLKCSRSLPVKEALVSLLVSMPSLDE